MITDNIIFDLGGVLIDLKIEESVRAFAALGATGLDVSDIHPHQKGVFLDYEIGAVSSRGFIDSLRADYDFDGVSDVQMWDAWNTLLQDVDIDRFRLLRRLDKRIFLLSNTNEAHIEAVKANFRKISSGAEFESFFERCFYSYELGCRKPDRKIYEMVVDIAGIDPSRTLFIDDNECNFSGAHQVGIRTHHFTNWQALSLVF